MAKPKSYDMRLTVQIERADYDMLAERAEALGISRNEGVRRAVAAWTGDRYADLNSGRQWRAVARAWGSLGAADRDVLAKVAERMAEAGGSE